MNPAEYLKYGTLGVLTLVLAALLLFIWPKTQEDHQRQLEQQRQVCVDQLAQLVEMNRQRIASADAIDAERHRELLDALRALQSSREKSAR